MATEEATEDTDKNINVIAEHFLSIWDEIKFPVLTASTFYLW